MTRPVSIQIYVSRELGARVREAARARELDVSTWVRSLLAAACEDAELASRPDAAAMRSARQGVFVMVGVDALLAGHSDRNLRERAHQAYARKCRELGLGSPSEKGGSDEA
jgi:hypothetical protein